jgi:hypothetical protein
MISHGASAINVSFIVEGCRVDDAVRALHREFFQATSKSVETRDLNELTLVTGSEEQPMKIAIVGYGKMGRMIEGLRHRARIRSQRASILITTRAALA